MLRQRILTALAIVLPVFLLIVFGPTWLFAVFVLLTLGLGAWEWARLGGLGVGAPRAAFAAAIVLLAGALLLLGIDGGWSALHVLVLALAVLWWFIVFLGLVWYRPGFASMASGRILLRVAGFLTLIPAALALVWLHDIGPGLVIYLILLVAAADTGAFFTGRRFGRNKLAPEISPGKTREGVLGALGAVFVVAVAASRVFGLSPMDALVFVLLSIVVALLSVAGDLQESVLKREAGAKDSGTLLPGHGGVLDRVDSLTAAAPVLLAGLLWASLLNVGA
jgi:phosphatidate cytidylyltransferase